MYNQEMLTFSTDAVLKFLVYYHHFVFIYNFLVRHNRILNYCHEVNKLLNYWNKYSRLFNKGECFILKL